MTIVRINAILAFTAIFMLFSNAVVGAQTGANDQALLEKEIEVIKSKIERPTTPPPALMGRYNQLAKLLNECSPMNQIIKSFGAQTSFAPASNLCISGASLAVADPTYNRVIASSTGTGIGTGAVGNCSLSGSGNATHYDVYAFNLTGCAVFPTVVTAQLCGPAGCTAPAAVDTILTLYRAVAAGDPLTANGGLAGNIFNPGAACTNAVGGNDDSGATPTSTGGSTCNQSNTADCLAQCPVSTSLSEFKRNLGNGRFVIVVTGFGNATTGSYNLYVDAPAAGCSVLQTTTAAAGTISGRISTAGGQGINGAIVTLAGGELGQPMLARSNAFGYYTLTDIPVGQTYILSVSTKGYGFDIPSRAVNFSDSLTDQDFVASP